jgi:hypothetical protein
MEPLSPHKALEDRDMHRNRPQAKLLTTAVLTAVYLLTGPQAAADAISPAPADLTLWAGRDIWLGADSTVNGGLLAGRNVSVNQSGDLRDVYSVGNTYLDRDARIAGSVLAGGSANAGRNLNVTGNWTGLSVGLDRDAFVGGDITAATGQISLSRNADVGGSVGGNAGIWIDRDSSVAGDVSPGPGRSLSTGRNVSIGGSREAGPTAFDTLAPPAAPDRPTSAGPGSEGIWRGRGENLSLDPGEYASVGFGPDASLSLSAGDYTMSSFWMDRDGVVTVDTTGGDVTLDVLGGFSTGRNVTFDKVGDGQFRVNVLDGPFWLARESKFEGLVSVWGGDLGADADVELEGAFYATGNIDLGSGANVIGAPGAAVPEPAAASLLLLGLLPLLRRRKV